MVASGVIVEDDGTGGCVLTTYHQHDKNDTPRFMADMYHQVTAKTTKQFRKLMEKS